MKLLLAVLISVTATRVVAADIKPLHKLEAWELEHRLTTDAAAAERYRHGLLEVIKFMDAREDLFSAPGGKLPSLLRRDQKVEIWAAWQRFLDYQLALASLESYYQNYSRVRKAAKNEAFLVGQAAFLARYRSALDFISRAERLPELDKILNEPVPELGLPANSYGRLKFKFLNVAIAGQFAAREVLVRTSAEPGGAETSIRAGIAEDTACIWAAGKGRGELLTAANAVKIVRKGAETAWFPVQAGVAEWMGDTKVYRTSRALISEEQIAVLQPGLRPGDILLERREWFLSNIGLPGFWSHAALYIGTPEERRDFFSSPAVRKWVQEQGEPSGDFENLLKLRGAIAWEKSRRPQEAGHAVRVLEAMSEGVSFTTLEHSAACDSLAILRPRVSDVVKARALLRAFHYSGRPYDFEFDFATDAALVCTEVVYKAYEGTPDLEGLFFPLSEMLGRKVLPANDLAKQFDDQFGTTAQQTDLVAFLDGQEWKRQAVSASVDVFRRTWKRPKWHVLVQATAAN